MTTVITSDMPSNLQQVAAMISGTGDVAFSTSARAVSLRVPEDVLARVDAMAKLARQSRNTIMIYLLEGAMEQVQSTIDQPTQEKLNEAFKQSYAAFSSDGSELVTVSGSGKLC